MCEQLVSKFANQRARFIQGVYSLELRVINMYTKIHRMISNCICSILNNNQYTRDRWIKFQANRIQSGATVLDIGAGSCPYRKFFAHCEYRTHDFSRLGNDQLSGGNGYGYIDYVSDIVQIPVSDGSFDVIVCTEVLEHVPEPIRTVREFSRILKPGGRLLLSAPLGSGLHQEPYHFYGGYTPYWYERFLGEAGFVDIVVDPNGGFFKHYGQECIRFTSFFAPWKKGMRSWFPFWLLILPWFGVICPILAQILDRKDTSKGFTVGYHVVARRA